MLENTKLRYSLVRAPILYHICQKIVKKYGILAAMSGKAVSEFEEDEVIFDDILGIESYFKRKDGIILRTIEAISMAYICFYYENKASPKDTYYIGVDIEDKLKGQTEREVYFSDGLLSWHKEGRAPIITPFQQVSAQNVVGANKGIDIQKEIIKMIVAKCNRRNTYGEVYGLIVSVLPESGSIDIAQICEECDLTAFSPTLLLVYEDNLKTCLVIDLTRNLGGLEELKSRSLKISSVVGSKN